MAGAKLIELSSQMRKRDQFVGRWHTLSQRFPRQFSTMQAPQTVLLFPKNANLQGIDGRSQMWSGFPNL